MAEDAYRDALAAAHTRIAELERERDERANPQATRLAALRVERARAIVAAERSPASSKWPWGIVVAAGPVIYAIDQDMLFSVLGAVVTLAVTYGKHHFDVSEWRRASRHVQLIDEEIARMEAATSAS